MAGGDSWPLLCTVAGVTQDYWKVTSSLYRSATHRLFQKICNLMLCAWTSVMSLPLAHRCWRKRQKKRGISWVKRNKWCSEKSFTFTRFSHHFHSTVMSIHFSSWIYIRLTPMAAFFFLWSRGYCSRVEKESSFYILRLCLKSSSLSVAKLQF